SCPDWSNPCKHIAAVYYLLAERFDEDPFLIFKLRGRTKEQIIQILRKKRVETEPTENTDERSTSLVGSSSEPDEETSSLEACLETFWQTGEALDSFVVNPSAPSVENAILKRLGDAPFTVDDQNIAGLLSKAYAVVGTQALQKASGECEFSGKRY
ncbi:MAG: hypothetical protein L0Y56_14235, partial [Nitrospira sp.]|nr:hypothetical protein [Nitrospira sp.]